MNKDNLWYLILLPIIAIILFILSTLNLIDTSFEEVDRLENLDTTPQETTP